MRLPLLGAVHPFTSFLTHRVLSDRVSLIPAPVLVSPPRSAEFLGSFGDLRQSVLPSSGIDENRDEGATVDPGLSETGFQEESKGQHVSSENKEPIISEESRDNLGEINGELMSSNEEKVSPELSEPEINATSSNEEEVEPVSSKPDPDEKTAIKSEFTGAKEKSRGDSDEGINGAMSSNEEITYPISFHSDVDDDSTKGGPQEDDGVEEKSMEGTASPDIENGGVINNVSVEKLRNCDIYKGLGTWVRDEGYPLYKPGSCPYVDDGFDCQGNGRPDSGYTQWR